MASAHPLTIRPLVLGGAAVLALAAVPAAAHHGWSTYPVDDFSLTGTVTEVRLGNPHDILMVEADEGVWEVWLSPPSRSRQAGFDESAIAVGDTVTAYGNRHGDMDRLEMKTEKLTVNGEEYALYPERLTQASR